LFGGAGLEPEHCFTVHTVRAQLSRERAYTLDMNRASPLAVAVLLATPVWAHHGGGTFDRNKNVELMGTITGIDFVNPHSWIYFDVVGADGAREAHRCEMRAATVLRRSGWTPEMFRAGEQVTITGRGDRFDERSCYLTTIVFANGSRTDRYGQLEKAEGAGTADRPLRSPSGEPNIFGDWASEQLVMTDPTGRGGALVPLSTVGQYRPGEGAIGDPTRAGQGGARQYATRDVELTELGKREAAEFQTYTVADNPRMRCETTSILFDWTFDGAVNRITRNADTIVIQYGQFGFTRTIHMNVAAHPAAIEPSRAGHSLGRWDGDVLVVDTVGFAPGVLSPPILNSSELHVVERFSLDASNTTLKREYVAQDPVYFVGDYVGSDAIPLADVPYSPDTCKELTFVDYSSQGAQRTAPTAPQ
jgi:hypothetical protein